MCTIVPCTNYICQSILITSRTLGNIEPFQCSLKTYPVWPYEFKGCSGTSVVIERGFTGYNEVRRHSSIDYPLHGIQVEITE